MERLTYGMKRNKSIAFPWQPFSDKQLKVLTWWTENSPVNEYDGIICDGAVRSGKSIVMSIAFVNWAMERFNERDFAFCGKTISALRRNVINTLKQQLISLDYEFEEHRTENLIIISNSKHTNYFYTFGGKDESSQDLIQGMTLAGVLFDEVALMPQSFVSQAEARCSVEGAKFWYNCNPKAPTHWYYKDYIEDEKYKTDKQLLYLHFTMDDNLTLSEKVKERYRRMFSGVFYQRNILGLWVTAEGQVYINFGKDNIIDVDEWYSRNAVGQYINPLRQRVKFASIGVDFGGNLSSTTFNCTVFTQGLNEAIVVKERRIKEEITPDDLNKAFVEFVKDVKAEFPMCNVAYVDSAEQVLKRGLINALIKAKIPLAVKDARKGEIIDRIRWAITMFEQHRFFIVSNCKETIDAYYNAVWDEKHEDVRLDDGSTNIDSLDSTEYSYEHFMKPMLSIIERG